MQTKLTSKAFFQRVTRPEWLWTYGCMLFCLVMYFGLNHTLQPVYHIYSPLDDYIPFNEWFALPYVYWFGYIPVSIAQILWHYRDNDQTKHDFKRYMIIVYGGWLIVCLLFVLFPSTIDFRPTDIVGDNFCAEGLRRAYLFDRPVNVMPSLHCYSTVAIAIGICRSSFVKVSKYKKLHLFYNIMVASLICVATVVVKQHSILDVFGSLALVIIMEILVYRVNWQKAGALASKAKQRARTYRASKSSGRKQRAPWFAALLPPC